MDVVKTHGGRYRWNRNPRDAHSKPDRRWQVPRGRSRARLDEIDDAVPLDATRKDVVRDGVVETVLGAVANGVSNDIDDAGGCDGLLRGLQRNGGAAHFDCTDASDRVTFVDVVVQDIDVRVTPEIGTGVHDNA